MLQPYPYDVFYFPCPEGVHHLRLTLARRQYVNLSADDQSDVHQGFIFAELKLSSRIVSWYSIVHGTEVED